MLTARDTTADKVTGLDAECRRTIWSSRFSSTSCSPGCARVTGVELAMLEVHIFDRFHRATTSPGGAGLGLAIGDAVMQATGGRWEVGVSPAGGARMAVLWPAARGPREPEAALPLPIATRP